MNQMRYEWALDQIALKYPDPGDPIRKTVTAVFDTWIRTDSTAFSCTDEQRSEALDVFYSLACGRSLDAVDADTEEHSAALSAKWAPIRQYPEVSRNVRVSPTFTGRIAGVTWPIAGQQGTLIGARRGIATVQVLHPDTNGQVSVQVPTEHIDVDISHLRAQTNDEDS